MDVQYSITTDQLKNNLQKIELAVEVKSTLILVADDGICTPEFLTETLNHFSKPIIGGLFPEIFVFGEKMQKGVLLLPLSFELKTSVFDLRKEQKTYFEKFEFDFSIQLPRSGSIFVFTDPFSEHKNIFIESLYNFFGISFTFLGAGCGTYDFKSLPCVIHNTGIFAEAAVVGLTNEPISLGVAHGWTPISEPLKVTEGKINQVTSINWEPAFDIYKRIVEKHSGETFNESNFQSIAKSYPLGLIKLDGEMIIRDTFKVTDKTLNFFDNVEKGQYFYILHGDKKSLLEGASIAREKCINTNTQTQKNDEYVFCIDCFSRVQLLEEEFKDELKAISCKHTVHGALTLGEIACLGESFLEIYNKTVIVAKWNQIF